MGGWLICGTRNGAEALDLEPQRQEDTEGHRGKVAHRAKEKRRNG
jgi:hypothetical protein